MQYAANTVAASEASTSCELADLVRRYGPSYAATHRLRGVQSKALAAIARCRTPAMGGHRHWCRSCGYQRYTYHSCRNRHCPKCQTATTTAWVAARRAELLPVPYFHHVFTLPHDLNPLILFSERNQRALLKLLFDATAQTLLEFGRQEFDGKVGFTLVLHTWDQRLQAHFHVHCLMASGALSKDGSRWIAGGRQFLFPVRALSKMFRGKYLAGLADLFEVDALDLPPQLMELSELATRRRWLRRRGKKSWVVYSQRPFAGPRKLVDYLGRYTHRVAIANHRIVSCDGGQVTYRYRDRSDEDRVKTETISAEQFLDRFRQHILPDGFQRIRHYGLLANCGKRKRLAHCRKLLGAPPVRVNDSPQTVADWLLCVLGIEVQQCPRCGSPLDCERLRPPQASPETLCHIPDRNRYPPWNTS